MATKKTTSTKKKSSTGAKKTVKRSSAKTASKKALRFGLQPETERFMTFRITKQTLYWLVLGTVVILFSMWILRLQADIQTIYDEIDIRSASLDPVPYEHKR